MFVRGVYDEECVLGQRHKCVLVNNVNDHIPGRTTVPVGFSNTRGRQSAVQHADRE